MIKTIERISSGLKFSFACPPDVRASVMIFLPGTDKAAVKADFVPVPYGGNWQEAIVPEAEIAKLSGGSGVTEYLFCTGEGEDTEYVVDPGAQLVTGRTPFGEMGERKPTQVRAAFCDEPYDWGEDREGLQTPYEETVAYYLHVRGFTNSPSSHVRNRGTFAGIAEKIPYLKELGINQVILMPAYEYEEVMREKENRKEPRLNYWGYTASWYFAPKAGYSSSARPDTEFKDMVKAMHAAGIEVVMEFSFPDEVSGDLALAALAYWVKAYHIDGFRLLARDGICRLAASCPELKRTKLMGAYFDAPAGSDGRAGRTLADCNTGFRNDCRKILKGDDGMLASFVSRVRQDRDAVASVNYITDHDGFTLCDLVSYDRKHNEENGEQGMDGAGAEFSWNCGVEGPSRKMSVQALRLRQMKNAFAMLLLSKGTPMILAGDEFANSQGGNNNPYCIDSEVTWLNWDQKKIAKELGGFVRDLIAFRRAHPVLRTAQGGDGSFRNEKGYPAVSCHTGRAWFSGCEYQDRHVGMMYCGTEEGEDTYLYVAYNFHWDEQEFALPYLPEDMHWTVRFSTDPKTESEKETCRAERSLTVPGRCITVLEGIRNEEK